MKIYRPNIINFQGTSFDLSNVKALRLSKEPKQKNGVISTLTIEYKSRPEYIFNPLSGETELESIKDTLVLTFYKWEDAKNAQIELEKIWKDFLQM